MALAVHHRGCLIIFASPANAVSDMTLGVFVEIADN
jgi:hypothetical protein